ELGGAPDTVLDRAALEGLRALDADAPRLKRPEARGNDDGARVEARTARGAEPEAPALVTRKFRHLMSQVQLRLERLDLLQQPVDQLLCAAHRQRRDVVDGLVGIELGTLSARMLQRVDHVRADAEESQLEHLEQPAGSGADDDDL